MKGFRLEWDDAFNILLLLSPIILLLLLPIILFLLSINAAVSSENPGSSKLASSSIHHAPTATPQYENSAVEDRDWEARVQHSLATYEYHASKNIYGLQAPKGS